MSSEPPPWAAAGEAPPPLSRRRITLLVVVALLMVALIVSIMALRSALDSVIPSDAVAPAESIAIDIPDCGTVLAERVDTFITDESRRIGQIYGTSTITTTSYQHPDGFPTAAFAWASVQPTCGTTFVIPDGTGVAYYVDAAQSTRDQFDGVSEMLTSLDYAMTADEVERELLVVETSDGAEAEAPEATDPVAADAGAEAPETTDAVAPPVSAYRQFLLPDGRRLWMQFVPFDDTDPHGAGDLYFAYFPAA